MRALISLLLLAAASGCVLQPPVPLPRDAIEIAGVPFFPQRRYQCGPAALATLLRFEGIEVHPDGLVNRLQIPERRGSLQIELVAASREYNLVPLVLQSGIDDLLDELRSGRPVLVLQNLGPRILPRWHYAVVIGYDGANDRLILRSGTTRRRLERSGAFAGSWERAGHWALVLFRPPDIPASAAPDGYVRALFSQPDMYSVEVLDTAISAGIERWPENELVLFAAANHARRRGRAVDAAQFYQRLLQVNPEHLGGLNNYADLLLQHSCIDLARSVIDRAVEGVPEDSQLMETVRLTAKEIQAASNSPEHRSTEPVFCQQAGR